MRSLAQVAEVGVVNLMDSRGTPDRWRAEPHEEMAWVGLTQGGPAQGEVVIALTTFCQGGEPPPRCDRRNLRVECEHEVDRWRFGAEERSGVDQAESALDRSVHPAEVNAELAQRGHG